MTRMFNTPKNPSSHLRQSCWYISEPTYTRETGSIVWLIWQKGQEGPGRVIKKDRRHPILSFSYTEYILWWHFTHTNSHFGHHLDDYHFHPFCYGIGAILPGQLGWIFQGISKVGSQHIRDILLMWKINGMCSHVRFKKSWFPLLSLFTKSKLFYITFS